MKTVLIMAVALLFYNAKIFGRESGKYNENSNETDIINRSNNDSVELSKNSFYLELLGNGGLYSLNYERNIFNKNKISMSGRVGISYIHYKSVRQDFVGMPLLININYRLKRRVFIEMGIGGNLTYNRQITYGIYSGKKTISNEFKLWNTALVGIKYQSNNGFLIRAGFTPLYTIKDPFFFMPWGGISLGYCF